MWVKYSFNLLLFSILVLGVVSALEAQNRPERRIKIKIPFWKSQRQNESQEADGQNEGQEDGQIEGQVEGQDENQVDDEDETVPESDSDLISFYLYNNNQDVNDTTELRLNDTEGILNSGFKPGQPVKVLIHGFQSSGQNPFPLTVKDAYLMEANGTISRNIIAVDWGRLANGNPLFIANNYIRCATKNVPMVGEKVGRLLEFLINNNLTTLNDIHIIGHSLGAHASGLAGDYILQKFGLPVSRITGLDPAGPLFYTHKAGRPLNSSDAAFVDIIHTDAFALGKAGKIGDADFYPNGGMMMQDNCQWKGIMGTGLASQILTLGSCSHSQAYNLFKDSIGNTNLRGCKCSNYVKFKAGMCPCEDGDENQAILGENILPG